MASAVGPTKGSNRGFEANSHFTNPYIYRSAFRSALISGRRYSSYYPTSKLTTFPLSSSSISGISGNPLSILPSAVLPLLVRPIPLASHTPSSSLLSHFLPVAHCRAEAASDQTLQPWAYRASSSGSGRGSEQARSGGKEKGRSSSASADDDKRGADVTRAADVSRTANVITGQVDGKVYVAKLRSLYSAFCPRGMTIMAVRNSLIQILPLLADYIEAQAPILEDEEEEEEEEGEEWEEGERERRSEREKERREREEERERKREVAAAERERKVAAFWSMDAWKIAAGTLRLSFREMSVVSVRRALEHFYLARSVSVRWLWKLTKDPTQSAVRKVSRGLSGTRLITSVTVTNVRAQALSPLSSILVQFITDFFTAIKQSLFPPPPPPSSSLQAGQRLAISRVKAIGVQIVWLVKRTLGYSVKLGLSTASGALVSAVCVRYVGPWTTSYAYILGDMLMFQTASPLIDQLLFGASSAAKKPGGGDDSASSAELLTTTEGFYAGAAAGAAGGGVASGADTPAFAGAAGNSTSY